ncbi:MAG TPA: hypothetical protein VF572_01020 [Candidatus Saccharimonadales bacterium]|jgi:hypothetical protein
MTEQFDPAYGPPLSEEAQDMLSPPPAAEDILMAVLPHPGYQKGAADFIADFSLDADVPIEDESEHEGFIRRIINRRNKKY